MAFETSLTRNLSPLCTNMYVTLVYLLIGFTSMYVENPDTIEVSLLHANCDYTNTTVES